MDRKLNYVPMYKKWLFSEDIIVSKYMAYLEMNIYTHNVQDLLGDKILLRHYKDLGDISCSWIRKSTMMM